MSRSVNCQPSQNIDLSLEKELWTYSWGLPPVD